MDPDPDPLLRGPDPDPHQNVTDPQHCCTVWKICNLCVMSVAVDGVVVGRRVVRIFPVEDELPVVLTTNSFLSSFRSQIPVLDRI